MGSTPRPKEDKARETAKKEIKRQDPDVRTPFTRLQAYKWSFLGWDREAEIWTKLPV